MAGSYASFPVYIESTAGTVAAAGAGVSVKVRLQGAGSDAAESPLTTDSSGIIASGSIAAASAGDIAHFRVENSSGLAGVVSQTLT